MEKDSDAETGLEHKWPDSQIHNNSQISGYSHRQGVEVEGTDCSSDRERQRLVEECNRLAKTSGGVAGRQMRRLYLAVMIPRMLYGVDVFLGPALRCESFKERKGGRTALNKLAAIQRSMALMIVGGLHTSPNDLLDMHANLLPFHLLVDKVRYQAALRLATLPSMHPYTNR